jgi:hypothetical protein
MGLGRPPLSRKRISGAAGYVFIYTVFLGSFQLSFLAALAAGCGFAAEIP